jgi:hypothetical protein
MRKRRSLVFKGRQSTNRKIEYREIAASNIGIECEVKNAEAARLMR